MNIFAAKLRQEVVVSRKEERISIPSGLSFQDLMTRQGSITTPKTPFTLGFECAGEVEAVGENVTKFKFLLSRKIQDHPSKSRKKRSMGLAGSWNLELHISSRGFLGF
ncbi:unnamed protein product [Bemisia tabaci]|uniref:Alcohol dehydrogenase-like N-terminal domain-containing protein n=1 Tax=Bemisia tabaci TaxID=7038 RepID=A0A9P0F578_BEMTA|nr:unnamed protein product [Bemisia tabaci]